MISPAEVASLMYHEVTDEPATTGFQRPAARHYTFTRAGFARHLDQIAAGPTRPSLVTGGDPGRPGRHVHLTFDDGGNSALYTAGQLEARGWRGHFFIVTARIGEPTFLDAAGIRRLHAAGHLVGTHSHTHPDIFRALPVARMQEEWRISCDIIGSITGAPCVVGSVPGGDISPAVLRLAADAGLRCLFTSEPWLNPRRVGSCWMLGRYIVKATLDPAAVRDLVELRGWKRAMVERWVKEVARRGLGSLYQAYVRHHTRPLQPAALK